MSSHSLGGKIQQNLTGRSPRKCLTSPRKCSSPRCSTSTDKNKRNTNIKKKIVFGDIEYWSDQDDQTYFDPKARIKSKLKEKFSMLDNFNGLQVSDTTTHDGNKLTQKKMVFSPTIAKLPSPKLRCNMKKTNLTFDERHRRKRVHEKGKSDDDSKDYEVAVCKRLKLFEDSTFQAQSEAEGRCDESDMEVDMEMEA